MKKTITPSLVAIILTLVASVSFADTVRLVDTNAAFMSPANFVAGNRSLGDFNTAPQLLTFSDNTEFIAFCVDPLVSLKKDNDYNYVRLADADFYSDFQKTLITQLVGYTFSKAIDLQTNSVLNEMLASSIQTVLWEITTESSLPGTLQEFYSAMGSSLTDGSFRVSSGSQVDFLQPATDIMRALYQDQLDAQDRTPYAATWDKLNYTDFTDYDIMVYYTDNNRQLSQTMLVVTQKSQNSEVPEPATLLIMGLGLAAIPVARRFRRK
ncbi:MAG: PEP-CTERM sorting domain-containing protein [Thermoguttaceae bacterium]